MEDTTKPQPKRARLRSVTNRAKEAKTKEVKQVALLGEDFNWQAWKSCPRFSRPIQGTRFICFKTPLSTCYEVHMEEKDTFTVDMFVERFSMEKSKEPICIVANAVWNSDVCYFTDKKVYEEWDIPLLNLPLDDKLKDIPAELVPPTDKQISNFIMNVKIKWAEDPLQIVGVTCTYGYNRSGVLIVAFLVEEVKMSLPKALKRFAEARPPGVYARPCLEYLHKKYGKDTTILIPEPPKWDKVASQYEKDINKSKTIGTSAVTAPTPPLSKDVKLPAPWQRAFSKRSQREYFFNPVTKKSVWDIAEIKD